MAAALAILMGVATADTEQRSGRPAMLLWRRMPNAQVPWIRLHPTCNLVRERARTPHGGRPAAVAAGGSRRGREIPILAQF